MKHINNFETFSVSHTNAEYDESIWINQAKEILNLENTTIEINNELVLNELLMQLIPMTNHFLIHLRYQLT